MGGERTRLVANSLHFRFPTPRSSGFAENNAVYGQLYRWAGRWQDRPAIILRESGVSDLNIRHLADLLQQFQSTLSDVECSDVTLGLLFRRYPRPALAGVAAGRIRRWTACQNEALDTLPPRPRVIFQTTRDENDSAQPACAGNNPEPHR
jgi:hypothetical protein